MKMKKENNGGKLNLIVKVEHAETVAEWVRGVLAKEPVEISKPFDTDVLLEIYFDAPAEAEAAAQSLPADLPVLSAEAVEYQAEEWTTFWRHHFRITDIGRRLRIVPEWEEAPADGKTDIIINPGLSFGTGGHFTTKFCLEALEEAYDQFAPQSMIDAGTGSGILAIVATKLGIEKVEAFDFDEVCVTQCVENAERNGVSGKIRFFYHDVLQPGWYSEPADLVCANILTSVLLEAAPLIKRAAKKRILLSGIREIEGDAVADTFIQFGCREVSRDGDGKWCGIVLDV